MEFLQSPNTWVAVAFIIFVLLVYKPVKRAMFGALDRKIEDVRQQVEEAKRLREEAQSLLAQYQRKQREAAKEAEALMTRAKADAEAHRKTVETALEATLARQEAQAKEKIAQAEAQAVREVRDAAVEVAVAATSRILTEQLDGPAGDAVIDRSISELPQKLH